MKILVIDVGGTHVKIMASGQRAPVKIPSGPEMSARKMAAAVHKVVADWDYDVVSMGYPGPVIKGQPAAEPHNLAPGWMRFDFKKAFGHPLQIINDAAMQALGSYEGGRMLFLGLGTGLGSAMVSHDAVEPLELAHLPYKNRRTYEEFLGLTGLKRLGKKKWQHHVFQVTALLKAALLADYVVLGGGNARLLKKLPPDARLGHNLNAFRGGCRLWKKT
jgi:polyphosphate glucokinase